MTQRQGAGARSSLAARLRKAEAERDLLARKLRAIDEILRAEQLTEHRLTALVAILRGKKHDRPSHRSDAAAASNDE